jgi:hypothetical protein
MFRRLTLWLAATGMGLAFVPAPSFAQASGVQGSGVLAADPQDFQCFVLLQQRREAFIASPQLDITRKAELVNNLTIISAFYAGRMSHYSSGEAIASFTAAATEVNGATPQQRDAFANICTDFYLRVMDVLIASGQPASAATPAPAPSGGR